MTTSSRPPFSNVRSGWGVWPVPSHSRRTNESSQRWASQTSPSFQRTNTVKEFTRRSSARPKRDRPADRVTPLGHDGGMRTGEVHELVDRAATLETCPRDRVAVEVVVDELRRLRAWIDGRDVAAARLVAQVSSFPEKSLADASRTNLRQAEQMMRRCETADQVPELGVSLDAGRVSGAHVDVLARTLRQVEPEVRDKLIEQGAALVLIAEYTTADEFARTVRAEARRLERVTDGLDRLERQRRAIRFSSYIDKESGMGRWQASWDPEMLRLETRIDQQLQAMFH